PAFSRRPCRRDRPPTNTSCVGKSHPTREHVATCLVALDPAHRSLEVLRLRRRRRRSDDAYQAALSASVRKSPHDTHYSLQDKVRQENKPALGVHSQHDRKEPT